MPHVRSRSGTIQSWLESCWSRSITGYTQLRIGIAMGIAICPLALRPCARAMLTERK